MNNGKKVLIKIENLDKFSYVEKSCHCDVCPHGTMGQDMDNCPIIKRIAQAVTRTTYSIDGSKLYIRTATYGHDFRRAIDVVNAALDQRCRQR